MPTTSIEEARKILGEEMSAKLSDEELQYAIHTLEAIARETIRDLAQKKNDSAETTAKIVDQHYS